MTRPWSPGAVTGIGSLPGSDPVEAAALVFGELPQLPHVPELPARGAGADLLGRTAALLVDLPVELVPSGWRIAAHPGRDLRRARDYLDRDLDAVGAAAAGHTGPLKVQAAGPWTLAAGLELEKHVRGATAGLRPYPWGLTTMTPDDSLASLGKFALASVAGVMPDGSPFSLPGGVAPGAVRDLADSLAEGLRAHLGRIRSSVPGADVVLQLDEPTLPAVLAGRLSTPSGYGTVRAVDPAAAERALRAVLAVAPDGRRVVHCCAPDVPLGLLRDAGADAVAIDLSLVTTGHYDALGEAVDAGASLWLGVLDPTDGAPSLGKARDPLLRLWSQLGFPPAQLARQVVPTPACGLAGSAPDQVRRVFALLRDVGAVLLDTSA